MLISSTRLELTSLQVSLGIISPNHPSSHLYFTFVYSHNMSAGTKRPHDREEQGEDGKRSKPKDWRDAFLDEDEPRRRSDDRHQSSRDRDHRSGSSRDPRDSDRDRLRDRDRDRGSGRDKDKERERDHYREREKGDSARRYGDTRDQRRDYTHDRDHSYDRRASSARRLSHDREEGECVLLV